jgi:hypothetical protein
MRRIANAVNEDGTGRGSHAVIIGKAVCDTRL